MTKLREILRNDSVDVLDTEEEFEAKRFETWKSAVEADENRAVSGIIRDGDDRVLLVKAESGLGGWRLPGSSVGQVVDFEARLRNEHEEQLGVVPETVRPHSSRPTPRNTTERGLRTTTSSARQTSGIRRDRCWNGAR